MSDLAIRQCATMPIRQRGVSIVEMMIAITIGLLITAALSILLLNISKANKEQFRAAQQIENGRFAMDLLQTDIRLAGYYGEFAAQPPVPGTLADPCTIPAEGIVTANTTNSPLAFYVQGYPAANLTSLPSIPAGCSAWLDANSVQPGSDIVVVRRLETRRLVNPEGSLDPATGSQVSPVVSAQATAGDIYAQTDFESLEIQYGLGNTITAAYLGAPSAANLKANGQASTLLRKDYTQPADPSTGRPTTAAYIRKLVVHVYYVSPCMRGSGTNGKCTAADGSVPTLKRLELGASSTSTRTMNVVPLVEGIEFLKILYGLDKTSVIAGKTVDGSVDEVVTAPATLGDWQNVMQVDIRLVARNPESSPGYFDEKTYDLGTVSYTPSGVARQFKRHGFASQVYIMNAGGRRES